MILIFTDNLEHAITIEKKRGAAGSTIVPFCSDLYSRQPLIVIMRNRKLPQRLVADSGWNFLPTNLDSSKNGTQGLFSFYFICRILRSDCTADRLQVAIPPSLFPLSHPTRNATGSASTFEVERHRPPKWHDGPAGTIVSRTGGPPCTVTRYPLTTKCGMWGKPLPFLITSSGPRTMAGVFLVFTGLLELTMITQFWWCNVLSSSDLPISDGRTFGLFLAPAYVQCV